MKFAKCASNLRPSAIRESINLKLINKPDIISFAGGSPDPASFPASELITANRTILTKDAARALQYSNTEGLDVMRQLVIEHLGKDGINNVRMENILITNGSQQGLDYCGRLFLDDGDVVICENPSYVGALNAFYIFNPTFVGVEMDEEGMVVEELEKVLLDNPRAKFIYTIPTYQNPSGRTMGQKRRQDVLSLSEKFSVPIVEDDPYLNLYYNGTKSLPIKHYDKTGNVIYLGTFSKTFCPGLRIGWICSTPEVIKKLTYMKQSTDLHTSTLTQMELAHLIINTDWDARVASVRELYKKKRDVMIESIEKYFPKNITYTYPEGGLFLWVDLPERIKAEDILIKSIEEKVAFVPGSPFYANGGNHNHLRLSFGASNEDDIRTGIRRLGKVLSSVCE